MEIMLAQTIHLSAIAALFDQYRVFYQQPSDLERASQFIKDRFEQQNSKILVAIVDHTIIGFTQLYPSFSSVSMQPVWILNDLYVAEAHRRQGAAKSLMEAAQKYATETGAIRLQLSTQASNVIAQALYTRLGYQRDQEFWHYSLNLMD